MMIDEAHNGEWDNLTLQAIHGNYFKIFNKQV